MYPAITTPPPPSGTVLKSPLQAIGTFYARSATNSQRPIPAEYFDIPKQLFFYGFTFVLSLYFAKNDPAKKSTQKRSQSPDNSCKTKTIFTFKNKYDPTY